MIYMVYTPSIGKNNYHREQKPMNTNKSRETLDDNNSERISSIRATVGAIEEMRIAANQVSSQIGRVFLTDQDRLLGLIEFARLNMKQTAQ